MSDTHNHGFRLVSVITVLFAGQLHGQSTLATFNLTEAFGVQWPVQNLEMQYNGSYPNPRTTRLMRQDGRGMPYQWIAGSDCWDSTAVNGCILVQDGLSAGSISSLYTTTYTLQSGIAPNASITKPVTITPGSCITGIAGWIIANGLGGFCVPRSQAAPYDAAPIQGLQLADGPLIYVEDSFLTANGSVDTSGKTLTWNLMAECTMTGTTTGNCSPVSTPAGNMTPVYRNITGCARSQIPTQYPSNTDISGRAPYALGNGLQAFHFTGMQWPAHATNGIDWDLWEVPSSGSAQFLLGHWSHGCNTSVEMAEFYQTNKTNPDMGYGKTGGPFISTSNEFESQDILRVHDTGVFKTVIAPYRKSETPTRTFTSGSCSNGIGGTVYQMVTGSETTCLNDSAMSFTNGTEQVLTTYDGSTESAFGLTATGGAQEAVNNGAGTITWTIEDITAGTRCITLPSGTWYPSTPVQHANGQFCYYHGGGPQPTPAVLTFTQNPLTIHNVTLSYDAPPNAAQVAVQFGSGTNYVAVSSCSPRCSISLELPAGTYSEQHTFMDANGNPITSSQPRSAVY